jgi:hypothetical protein
MPNGLLPCPLYWPSRQPDAWLGCRQLAYGIVVPTRRGERCLRPGRFGAGAWSTRTPPATRGHYVEPVTWGWAAEVLEGAKFESCWPNIRHLRRAPLKASERCISARHSYGPGQHHQRIGTRKLGFDLHGLRIVKSLSGDMRGGYDWGPRSQELLEYFALRAAPDPRCCESPGGYRGASVVEAGAARRLRLSQGVSNLCLFI